MTNRKTLTLTRAWGGVRAGTTLGVLLPGEALAPGLVDARRAAQLEADGFTRPIEPDPVEAEDDEAPKPRRKGGRVNG